MGKNPPPPTPPHPRFFAHNCFEAVMAIGLKVGDLTSILKETQVKAAMCATYIAFIAVSRQWSGLIGIDKHDSLLLVLYEVHSLVWFDKYCTVRSLSYASACYWRIR